jgi:hypothetical protein
MTDTTYRLLSTPMIYTPGILAWAINGYHFPEDRPQILKIMTETYSVVPEDKMDALLMGYIPYTVEDEAVVFS